MIESPAPVGPERQRAKSAGRATPHAGNEATIRRVVRYLAGTSEFLSGDFERARSLSDAAAIQLGIARRYVEPEDAWKISSLELDRAREKHLEPFNRFFLMVLGARSRAIRAAWRLAEQCVTSGLLAEGDEHWIAALSRDARDLELSELKNPLERDMPNDDARPVARTASQYSRDPKIRARQLLLEKNEQAKLNGAQPQHTHESGKQPVEQREANGARPIEQGQTQAELAPPGTERQVRAQVIVLDPLEGRADLAQVPAVMPQRQPQTIEATEGETEVTITDFYAYMPAHKFIFRPTGELWPCESINTRLQAQLVNGEKMKPAAWLDKYAPVEQMTWAPCEPKLIEGKLIDRGGWIERPGCNVFNLYRPAPILPGDPTKAGLWRAHLARIFPDEARHIECWLAHHVQRPGVKVNHGLVLQGDQGIGKDTILEPAKRAIGPWNWQDINPAQMLMRFNGWCRAVIVRVNEARDLGDFDRFAFYDHSKVYMAAPPDVLRVDEKNTGEYSIPNVLGVIITTNHESDGIYLDADDRRHFVASSEAQKEDFDAQYWDDVWNWYAAGGLGHVAAYLRTLDLSDFDAKAPPRKTEAFWRIVHSNAAPEDAELANLIESLGEPSSPPQTLTLSQLASNARNRQSFAIADFLTSLKTRRSVTHRMQQQGYVSVHNKDRKDGLWLVDGKRQAVYALRKLDYRTAVQIIRGGKVSDLGSEVQ